LSEQPATLAVLEAEARRLIEAGRNRMITLRLLGGLAVSMRCPSACIPPLQRVYADLDFVSDTQSGRRLEPFFSEMGYIPNKRFNLLNGSTRQLYTDPAHVSRQVDIFIGSFEMCQKLPLADRLHLSEIALPLAELLLSKLQIIQLNEKDALDVTALLLDHSVGEIDGEVINGAYIARLCSRNWGLFTTLMDNFKRLERLLAGGQIALNGEQSGIIISRIEALRKAMLDAPKSLQWKARARVGRSLPWFREVEEVQR
jgi:hypothetical protein